MRRYLGIIISIVLALAVIIGLSAAGNLEFDRKPESELEPIRSSYNSGPTGTRAFYQLLEESGTSVERWRDSFSALTGKAGQATLIIVGPFQREHWLSEEEASALQKWIAGGGNALIVSRFPRAEFGDPMLQAQITAQDPNWYAAPELLVDPQAGNLIAQPTDLTKI